MVHPLSVNVHPHSKDKEWSKKAQQENGNCLSEGYAPSLPDTTFADLPRSDLPKLRSMWEQLWE